MLIKRSSLELYGYFMFLFLLNRKYLMNMNACTRLWGLEYNNKKVGLMMTSDVIGQNPGRSNVSIKEHIVTHGRLCIIRAVPQLEVCKVTVWRGKREVMKQMGGT